MVKFPDFELRLRLILLLVVITVTVSVPYFLQQRASASAAAASRWVEHTALVKQRLFELMYAVRDLDSLAVSAYAREPFPHGVESFGERRMRAGELLGSLRELTRDNVEQQNRLGRLESLVNGRIGQLEGVMAAVGADDYEEARKDLRLSRELFGLRAIAEEFIAAEDAHFVARHKQLERSESYAHWMAAAVVLVQLVLLIGVGFVFDRTARHRASATRDTGRALAHAAAVLNSVRKPIAVVDRDLKLISSNPGFDVFYGGKPDVGEPLETIGGGAWTGAALLQKLRDVIAIDRELWDHEVEQSSAGGLRHVILNARRITLPDQPAPGILVTVNDITSIKQAESQILDLNRELRDRVDEVSEINRELESFSYSVSHDLRAPLRHIAGFCDKLEHHLGDGVDGTSRHYLDVIGGAARRMSTLIEDLLLYSRLGRTALRRQPVDMRRLIDDVRVLLADDIGSRRIDWQVGELPVVMADAGMMRQVWQNLLGNAVKYTSRREDARIVIRAEATPQGDYVFHVADNGVGFDMNYAGKLFGVFQRLHKPSEFPGTGIGLANVQRIVGRHGGRVWFDAEVDAGATFHFQLPGDGSGFHQEEKP